MMALNSQEEQWEGYRLLPVKELLQRHPDLLQSQVVRVRECKTVRRRDYFGEGYQEKWQLDTAQKRYVNCSAYGKGFYYNVFGTDYRLERGDRKVGDGAVIDFNGTSLVAASINGKIYSFYVAWHRCQSGCRIGDAEFGIDVEEPHTLFQKLQEIPTSFDLVQRNEKAVKYGLLIGQEIPEKNTSTEREAWCEQMWRKGWMFNAEEDNDKQERWKRCEELVPTLEHVLKYYLRIK